MRYTNYIKQKLYLLVVVIISGFIGYLSSYFVNNPQANSFKEIRSQGNYKFINPLLECEPISFGNQDKFTSQLKSKLENYINNQINKYQITIASIYYRDLNNGPWIGINEKELFSPSSLIKVPIMMSYYKLAESNPDILKTEIETGKTDNLDNQYIKPEVTIVPNQKYTIEELIRRMIVYSDNLAYELLNNNLTPQQQIDVFNNLGVDITKAYSDPNGNIISVKSYATFFRILFNSSFLSKDMSEKALDLLSQSTYSKGLVAGLPSQTKVSHKFGERHYIDTGTRQLHDCGIVYTPNPYLLCIMTRGQNFDNLTSTIKDISSIVYNTLQSQN